MCVPVGAGKERPGAAAWLAAWLPGWQHSHSLQHAGVPPPCSCLPTASLAAFHQTGLALRCAGSLQATFPCPSGRRAERVPLTRQFCGVRVAADLPLCRCCTAMYYTQWGLTRRVWPWSPAGGFSGAWRQPADGPCHPARLAGRLHAQPALAAPQQQQRAVRHAAAQPAHAVSTHRQPVSGAACLLGSQGKFASDAPLPCLPWPALGCVGMLTVPLLFDTSLGPSTRESMHRTAAAKLPHRPAATGRWMVSPL